MEQNGSQIPPSDDFADVRDLAAAGDMIGAIKRLRERTAMSLADAKRYVEALPGAAPRCLPPAEMGRHRTRWAAWLLAGFALLLGVLGIISAGRQAPVRVGPSVRATLGGGSLDHGRRLKQERGFH